MALSSRAHAFSVESLVGNSQKRKLQDSKEEEDNESGDPKKRGKEPLGTPRNDETVVNRPRSVADPDRISPDPSSVSPDCVQLELQGAELWRRFHEIGTEMIITKAGRRMFPSVRVKVKGLDSSKQYYIAMDIVPVDSKRYRYVYHSSQWMVAGNTDHSCISPRLYIHPDSPCSGETWMRQIISFDRVKLTNNEMDDKGHIILQSMHKYKPRVHVIVQNSRFDLSQIQSLPEEGVKTFSFKETEFTTVTAYQNQEITKLKIDRNPFAKGFRDPGRNRGVLDGLLETYPWRPSLPLDFKTFGAETHVGSSGSSPITSSGGTPSPLLSPSCSPTSFHLPSSNLGIQCPENYLHNLNMPLCYKICPTNILRPRSFLLSNHEKPVGPGGHILSPLMVDVPLLSSFGISKSNKLETYKGHCTQSPPSSNPMLFGLPSSGNHFPSNAISRESLNYGLHPPYGFYGYNLSVPSHFMTAASHLKMADSFPCSLRDVRCNNPHWQSTVNHCL
ncbi:T-box transcription factor TBX22 [Pelobates cultripes]|uniref:T-box transcription factor TBX22 n=2 Tax=Pelobates cultripes TaxID=61616 RepID=A0AAD1WK48_PELCU|nr:T-box transcription factor TBX22 [Pelobates cultripes]